MDFTQKYHKFNGWQSRLTFYKQVVWANHHIKIATFNFFDTYVANPFLNSVTSSFIKWFVVFYVEINFFIGKLLEPNFCDIVHGNLKIF